MSHRLPTGFDKRYYSAYTLTEGNGPRDIYIVDDITAFPPNLVSPIVMTWATGPDALKPKIQELEALGHHITMNITEFLYETGEEVL